MSIASVSSMSTSVLPTVSEVSNAIAARRSQQTLALRAADAAALAQRSSAVDDARKADLQDNDIRKAGAADRARQIAMAERTQVVDNVRSTSQAIQSRTSTNHVDLYL